MLNVLEIPNKTHFKLTEVCSLTGVKPYVLRFWESEFDDISPEVSGSGEKLFSHSDIEAIAIIKELLFTKKMNIEEAKATMLRNSIIEPDFCSQEQDQAHLETESTSMASLSPSDFETLAKAKSLLKDILVSTEAF
jgi:DNA-binding transcriptional MerR regulator